MYNSNAARFGVLSLLCAVFSAPAFADTGVSAGDTAWILTATALVLFMTLPGLALFYGGLVQAKNLLSVLMQCMAIAALMSIVWLACGYSLAFGPGDGGIIGGFAKSFAGGVTAAPLDGQAIPEPLFMMFQMTFANHHPGADRRRLCGTGEFCCDAGLLRALAVVLLCPCRPLGLGRRLALRHGRHRLCRRHRGAHDRGRVRRSSLR